METDDYLVRTMTRGEVDFAVELAAKEGWNPGLYDAECYYKVDPKGFLIGLLDGEPISSISVVKYGNTFGFLGFYIVKSGFRGRGLGFQIWEKGMEYLEGRDVGLDGVIEQTGNYQKSGFELAYYNTRYRGEALGSQIKNVDPRIVELSEISFEDLEAYDTSLVPAARSDFLRHWISQPQSTALGIIEHEDLAGYAVLRKCRVGYKIGPLFANDETHAEALFQALSRRVPQNTPIFLDVPGREENPAATALAKRHGMRRVFETARMYRLQTVKEINLPLSCWYGVTSFEIG